MVLARASVGYCSGSFAVFPCLLLSVLRVSLLSDLSPPRGFGRALPFPSPAGGLGSRLPVSSCCAFGGVFLVGGSACFARAVCVGAAGRAGASHPSALSCAPSRKMQTANARTHVAPLFRGGGLAACMPAGSCGGVLVSPAGGVLFPPRLSFSQLERRAPFFVWVFHCGSFVGPGGVSLLLCFPTHARAQLWRIGRGALVVVPVSGSVLRLVELCRCRSSRPHCAPLLCCACSLPAGGPVSLWTGRAFSWASRVPLRWISGRVSPPPGAPGRGVLSVLALFWCAVLRAPVVCCAACSLVCSRWIDGPTRRRRPGEETSTSWT